MNRTTTTRIECCKCGKPCKPSGISAGYAVDKDGNHYCYTCSSKHEEQTLRELPIGGKTYLYLTFDKENCRWKLQNWTGLLSIPIYSVKRGRHNFAGNRYDFWFVYHGNTYHGVQYGDNTEVATVTRIKGIKGVK